MMHRFGSSLRVLIPVLLIGVLVALLAAPQVLAQTTTAVVNTPKLNVRGGPSAGYAIAGQVRQDDVVTTLGRNIDASFVHIRASGNLEGWVSSLYLTSDFEFMTLPDHTNGAPVEPTAVVSAGSAYLRSGPGTNYAVLRQLGTGHVMGMLARTASSTWVNVRVDGAKGWIHASTIAPQSPISNLPVATPPPTVTPLPTQVATATPSESATASPTSTPGTAPTATATGNPPGSLPGGGGTAYPPGTAVVTAELLNLRTGPGPGYTITARLPGGTLVKLLGRNSDNSWVKVRTLDTNLEGWVSSRYVNPVSPPVDLPVLAEAEPSGVITTGAANMRSGPATTYPVVMVLAENSLVTLVGRNGNATWVQVRHNGITGWVHASSITTSYNIWYLPIGASG